MKLLNWILNFVFFRVAYTDYIYIRKALRQYNDNIERCFYFNEFYVCRSFYAPTDVSYSQDDKVTFYNCQSRSEWNLARIQTNKLLQRYDYGYKDYDRPVFVYVVDTHIQIDHPEFEGRAISGFNNVGGIYNSHGSHVAGIVGGKSVGVSRNAKIISVTVLNDEGSGTYSGIIEGLEWILRDADDKQRVIINMSLGGPKNNVIDKVVDYMAKQGMLIVVASGNSDSDACNSSPGNVDSVITVGSTNVEDKMSSFSNYGKCVDILAPGEKIRSAGSNTNYLYMSGTSMAAPMVSGVLANYLGRGFSNEAAKEALLNMSTDGLIIGKLKESPNKLVYDKGGEYCILRNPWFEAFKQLPLIQATFQ